MRIGCNNVKIKYLLLQRLINVVTQIFVATMNGICCNWQIFGRDLFDIYRPRLSLQTPASDRVKETYTGEKSNKYKQCDYASSQAGDLRTHLKTHSGEK